jgi:hypothetical protein
MNLQQNKQLIDLRRRGGDREYNLQVKFDIITTIAGRKK